MESHDVTENTLGWFANLRILVSYLCTQSKSSHTTAEGRQNLLTNLKFLVSRRGRLTILSVIFSPFIAVFLIVLSTDPAFIAGCGNCLNSKAIIYVIVAFAIVAVAFGVALAWITRTFPDRWGLARECRWLVRFAALSFIFFVAETFTPLHTVVFDFSLPLALTLGACLGVSSIAQVYIALEKDRRLGALRRASKLIRPSSRNESNVVSYIGDQNPIDALLADKNMLKMFEEHLAAELGIESLYFIQVVDSWKARYCTFSDPVK